MPINEESQRGVSAESIRFVEVLHQEIEVNQHSMLQALSKLVTETAAGPYQDFYTAAQSAVNQGMSLLAPLETHPEFRELFKEEVFHTIKVIEQSGDFTILEPLLSELRNTAE